MFRSVWSRRRLAWSRRGWFWWAIAVVQGAVRHGAPAELGSGQVAPSQVGLAQAAGGQEQDEEFTRRVIENSKLSEEKREAERRRERDGPGRER
jgi:hypothetical protein